MTWPSARHFKVTVTFENFQKFFFTLNDLKLPKMAKFSKKNFSKILRCDGHLKWRHSKWPWPSARHFKVTVTFERVTVTSLKWRADGQSHCLMLAKYLALYYRWFYFMVKHSITSWRKMTNSHTYKMKRLKIR